ncbi:cytochrome c family protein (plasmid) [Paraburkholderia fungorum]|jgi:thiosulfate dehydrogenase|uniref:C-type cytochrome n=1 Tax=Paraburkholderia fungorum TaxID=134537 RepID=A0AAP5QD44_9BURK|nr:c-type cytochrome [Paraburkholderia fungorum]AJZ56301.1 cytochrome c family protein [Paraburkholderia fungorum]MBB5545077.1 thiosulfate dehydrogenase [Paraburkholderia fungorum]MBU7442448.1 c-type cytochrome [Paraburkholderia fungorum]MDE1007265.1 c-type cytochrome [Paraburkholderia fungorum]MDT8840052.1 c-type cytochrome [Paraburkholderia fungorum]
MNTRIAIGSIAAVLAIAGGAVLLAGLDQPRPITVKAATPAGASASIVSTAAAPAPAGKKMFVPANRAIPDNDFGKVVAQGQRIFNDPARYAAGYVGNQLRCASCHLDQGRKEGAAPMWAAYLAYPAYRSKNHHVNTFAERLQGCFRYSMNGKAPPLGDPVLVALETYSYWLAQGAPLDPKLPGRGFPALAKPAQTPDFHRGEKIYAARCALCHGANGNGQNAGDGTPAFPALWGDHSYNWGAGMASVKNAAEFIHANMPLGAGGTLSNQDAWDVAMFVDSQERPQDPRYTGSVAGTRAQFHDSPQSMYGKTVEGYQLGSHATPNGGTLRGKEGL